MLNAEQNGLAPGKPIRHVRKIRYGVSTKTSASTLYQHPLAITPRVTFVFIDTHCIDLIADQVQIVFLRKLAVPDQRRP